MNKIILLILLVINFLFFKNVYTIENKIIFKIDNISFTTIDIDNRNKYLEFVGDKIDLNYEEVLNDFISVNIFNKFYIESKKEINLKDEVENIYNDIILANKDKADFNINNYNKVNIFSNLELDLIRKLILEDFLNSKKNEIFKNKDDIDLIYNFTINYVNVNTKDLSIHENKFNNIIFKNNNDVINFLDENNIIYYTNIKEINDITNINEEIKKRIISKDDFFIINKKNMVSFISIVKRFETYEGLVANIYSIDSKNKLNSNSLNCEKLMSQQSDNIIKKEYQFTKLNDNIKNNLINVNDYIEFKTDQLYKYVILCGIKFDKEVLNNLNISKNINLTVNKIEEKFVKNFSKKYNLMILNE